MEFSDVVRTRRMVRNFDDRVVDPDVLDRILDLSRRVPSAGFTQGTELLVLVGSEQTASFWDATLPAAERSGFAWPGLLHAPVLIIPCSSKTAYLDRYAEPDKGWTDRDELRWPVPYWDIDAAFTSMIILLATVEAGLGATFFGIFRGLEQLRATFALPPSHTPIGAIALGHPAADRPSSSTRRARRPLDDLVHRGSW